MKIAESEREGERLPQAPASEIYLRMAPEENKQEHRKHRVVQDHRSLCRSTSMVYRNVSSPFRAFRNDSTRNSIPELTGLSTF
jgi:hypothetical protein